MQIELSAGDTSTDFLLVALRQEYYECGVVAGQKIRPSLGMWEKIKTSSSTRVKGGAEPPEDPETKTAR